MPWTIRAENAFLPLHLRRGADPSAIGNVAGEARMLLDMGVDPSLEAWIQYENFLPTIADAHINPILTAEQRKIWRDEQKINFASMQVAHGSNPGIQPDAAREVDPDIEAALAEGPNP